jgi:non-specific serine/threonine protein kinase/serine/threonine-protein kinase
MTDKGRFQRIEALFHRLADAPTNERVAELATLQRDEPEVHAELIALLAESRGTQRGEQVIDDWTQQARAIGERGIELPASIGPYRIVRLLGEGGMGRVYEAEQERPVKRKVALKVIRSELPSEHALARFDAERQALAMLDHPNIARIFDAGTQPSGQPWFAMEFVDGLPITAYASAHRLSLRQRIELLLPVCDAVQHAHHKGIIHRDLKPSNLLIAEQGGAMVAKIIDFGIAKAIEPGVALRSAATRFGELVGTPEYMSPEQATLGSIDLDTRSDVYALGLVLYELLVGEPPMSRKELGQLAFDEICRRIREDEVPRPSARLALSGDRTVGATPGSSWAGRIRGDLDAVILKALAKDRDRRYDSISKLADDLRRYLADQPVLATPPSLHYRAGKFVRRHRAATAATMLALIALVGGSVVATLGWVEARRALLIAEQAQHSAEASSEFLLGLFKAADPRASPGENPDARSLLARGIRQLDAFEGNDIQRASVLETLGDVSMALAQFDDTRRLLDQAITLRESGPAANPERLAFLLDRRGGLARERAEFDAAKADYRRAMDVLTQAGQARTNAFGRSLNNLGIVYRMTGELVEATEVYQQALTLAQALSDEPSESVASVLSNLAALQHRQGDYAAASLNIGKALQQFEMLLPASHPHFASLRSNYAAIARSEGKLGLALQQIRLAAANEASNLPAGHIDQAYTLYNEAAILLQLGGLDVARERLLLAQDLLVTELGDATPRLNVVRSSLAQIDRLQGRPAESIRALHALDSALQKQPAASARRGRITALRHVSLAQRDLGELDAALETLQQVAMLASEKEDRGELAQAHLQRALIHLDRDDLTAADADWQQALSLATMCETQACELDRPSTGVQRAQYLARTGQIESALKALRYAFDQRGWSAALQDHSDLSALHDRPEWQVLRTELDAKLAAAWAQGGGR